MDGLLFCLRTLDNNGHRIQEGSSGEEMCLDCTIIWPVLLYGWPDWFVYNLYIGIQELVKLLSEIDRRKRYDSK